MYIGHYKRPNYTNPIYLYCFNYFNYLYTTNNVILVIFVVPINDKLQNQK